MYNSDLDSLIGPDGVVRVACSRFPVEVNIDASGIRPARFTLVQIPGTGTKDVPSQWVAVAWSTNPAGGTPNVILNRLVARILAFRHDYIDVVATDGTRVIVRSTGGCTSCAAQLSRYRGWPQARLMGLERPEPTP